MNEVLLCMALMLDAEARGEELRGRVAVLQSVLIRYHINLESPGTFLGGTDICDLIKADMQYAYSIQPPAERLEAAMRTVKQIFKYKPPLIAGGAPCFRTIRGTEDAIVIGNHEYGWWCAY